MTYTNSRNKALNVLLIILLFTSVDTLWFGTNSQRAMLFVPRIIGVLCIFAFPIIKSGTFSNWKINIKKIAILIFFLLIISISSLVNHEYSMTYISRIITVSVGYIICRYFSERKFAQIFDCFMTIVSVSALILEFFAYTMPSLLSHSFHVTNSANKLYYSFFVSSIYVENNIGNPFIRASGIFWEPGAFAIFLIFALVMQLFIFEKTNNKKAILYVITIVFTFSTTGYVALVFLIMTFVLSPRNTHFSRRLKGLFVLMLLALLGFMIYMEDTTLYNNVFGKLTNGTSSATTRYSSLFNGLNVAFDHPFLGVASQSQDYMSIYVNSSENLYTNGGLIIANTIVAYMVSYGLLFGIVFSLGIIRYFKKYSRNNLEWIMLSVTIFLAFSGERFFSFFPFVFVFTGLARGRSCFDENSCD